MCSNTLLLLYQQCNVDGLDLAIPLQTMFLWYSYRFSIALSIRRKVVQQLISSLPQLFCPKQANNRGRPRRQTEAEKLRNLEMRELQQDQQGLQLISLLLFVRELVRDIRSDKRGISFSLEEQFVCDLLNSCWNKNCVLASSPHLWVYAKSLLIVGFDANNDN